MKKTLKLLLGTTLLITALAGCGSSSDDSSSNVIKVGATPFPHSEILEEVKPILAEQGFELQIVEYVDYVQPNLALQDGSLNANYYQHVPFLDQFNDENNTELTSVTEVHYFPLGLYPGKLDSLDNIPEGATVAVPNDVSNEARALLLLEAEGLIALADGAGINATIADIIENPYNLNIVELEAAQIPRSLQDVDLAIITGNYAVEAELNVVRDALAVENASSVAYDTYGIVLAVKEGNEQDPAILALVDAITSEEVQGFINDTYEGSVVPLHY